MANLAQIPNPCSLLLLPHPGQVDEGGPDGGHCGAANECLSGDVEVAVLNLKGHGSGVEGSRRKGVCRGGTARQWCPSDPVQTAVVAVLCNLQPACRRRGVTVDRGHPPASEEIQVPRAPSSFSFL